MTDPISDMLTRIKNAYMARQRTVTIPHSRMKDALAIILKKEGFIDQISIDGDILKKMIITLKYPNGTPALTDVKRISSPGRRVYVKHTAIPRVLGGLGVAVISTPQGLMIDREAKKNKLGGEVVCAIW